MGEIDDDLVLGRWFGGGTVVGHCPLCRCLGTSLHRSVICGTFLTRYYLPCVPIHAFSLHSRSNNGAVFVQVGSGLAMRSVIASLLVDLH